MRFDVLTLFPDSMNTLLGESIIGRARDAGIITINTVNIRDFSQNKHGKVDDYPFGGGTGMVMTAQPIHDAWRHVTNTLGYKAKTIYMSPQGSVLTQQKARELLKEESLILLCGHYEGVDERILELIVDEEISIGDYVLTGGELPAMVLIDCISRMVPGVLPTADAFTDESHYDGLLEHPQYTRPAVYEGKHVPEVLLSGHHVNVSKWRASQQLSRTAAKRPDLHAQYIVQHPEKVAEILGLGTKRTRKRSKKPENTILTETTEGQE